MESKVILGDCLTILPTLEERSVHCIVTSPPYFALRSYLPKDHPDKGKEIGSEPTPEAFIETMVRVFREVRRVLRDDGVMFLNLGDGYGVNGGAGKHKLDGMDYGRKGKTYQQENHRIGRDDMAGHLLNIPHRVAEALRADGWIWRQTIVWAKRSPMPESVQGWRWQRCRVKVAAGSGIRISEDFGRAGHTYSVFEDKVAQWSDCPGCPKCAPNGGYVLRRGSGRCTTAHEYVFILTKSNRYFWGSEQIKEEATNRAPGNRSMPFGTKEELGGSYYRRALGRINGSLNGAVSYRNPRSVWTLSSEPTSEAHFATFPSELVRRCLSAGVSGGGCCPECGAPWAPVVKHERVATRPGTTSKIYGRDLYPPDDPRQSHSGDVCGNRDPERHCTQTKTLGYRPTCCHYDDRAAAYAKGLPRSEYARKRYQQDSANRWYNRSLRYAWLKVGDWQPRETRGNCITLDPFGGLCTVAQVARHMGHDSISIELNPKYVAIAKKRILKTPRCFLRKGAMPTLDEDDHPLLFKDLT